MGASALQKYVNSLGGIGTSGVGSSSSYSTKELSKEVLPEKVSNLKLTIIYWQLNQQWYGLHRQVLVLLVWDDLAVFYVVM